MHRVEQRPDGGTVTVRVCDVCSRPITDADPGGPVFPRTIRIGKSGTDYRIRDAHAGRCAQVAEERLAAEHPPHTGPEPGAAP